ncbi:MAG: DUF2523 family protein [Acidithiobacillus sp.]
MIDAIFLLLTTIGTWLLKNIGPQILLSLGIGIFSYTGYHALAANATSALTDLGSTAASFVTLIHMFGIVQGLQVFLSAISIKVSLLAARIFFINKASS